MTHAFLLFLALLLPQRPAAIPPTATPDPRPTIAVDRGWLPAVLAPGRVTPAPLPTARPTLAPSPVPPPPLRPTTYEELRRAVAQPGAHVLPAPGVYWLARNLKIARNVTLDGGGQVVLLGKTIELYEADGAVIRRLEVRDAGGDGIRVSHTSAALIEQVRVSGSGDGEIDVVELRDNQPSVVVIRDTIVGPGRKCTLLGDPDQGQDAGLLVILERVSFRECVVRTPKVHHARVEIWEGSVFHWTGPRLDVQMGGLVRMRGASWVAGPGSLMTYYLPTGGRVEDLGGNTFRPWRGAE